MKRVKIFLASSITDLKFDRVEIGNFFRQMNDIYIESGVYFDLVMCEDYDNTIALEGKQSQFDAEIRGSELVFFLFFKKVGDYTRHEFEIALDEYRKIGKPRILTYFKYVTTPEDAEEEVFSFMQKLDTEVKHYYNVYNCIDTLKLGIFMQIKMMRLDEGEIKLKNGKLLVSDREIADTDKIPLFSGNERLCEVRRELDAARKEFIALKASLLDDDAPDDAYIRFGEVASKKSELEKECARLESAILTTAENIARETAGESNLSEKQRAAYRFMQRGMWKEALEILDASEILSELSHNESLADQITKRLEINVAELLQRIEVLRSVGLNPTSLAEVYDLYAKVYETTVRHNLSKTPLLGYARFLNDQNDIEKCLAVAEKLKYYFSDPDADISVRDKATLFAYMGHFFTNAKKYEEAEESLRKAIDLFEGMADATDADRLETARSYNVLANTFFYRKNFDKMAETDEKAKSIFESLYLRHPDENDYAGNYAMSLDNYGIALEKTNRQEEGLIYHRKALRLYALLAEKAPVDYRLRYARCCHNTACSVEVLGDYAESERYFKEAIRIREEERLQNPHAVEPLLSGSHWCLGNLYYRYTGENEKAIAAYENAYAMRLGMRRRSPVYASEFSVITTFLTNACKESSDALAVTRFRRRHTRDLLTLSRTEDEKHHFSFDFLEISERYEQLRKGTPFFEDPENRFHLEKDIEETIALYNELFEILDEEELPSWIHWELCKILTYTDLSYLIPGVKKRDL